MSEIVMPRLSDTMEEGTILRWLKQDGATIARGEELVEIETDKATMVYESDVAGTLTLIAAEGETLPVGAPIARVGGGQEAAAGVASPAQQREEATSGAATSGVATPARQREQAAANAGQPPADPTTAPASNLGIGQPAADLSPNQASDGGTGQAAVDAPTPNADAGQATATPGRPTEGVGGDRIKASPLARRIARDSGIDLATVAGTGPGGRIVKDDVSGASAAAPPAAGMPPEAIGPPKPTMPGPSEETGTTSAPASGSPSTADAIATAKGTTTEVELNRLQQAVARRMAESKATIPDFAVALDVDMESCVALREELKRIAAEGVEVAPSYNDMVVKASALALREHPKANGSYRDGKLLLYSRVNVGVAVAAEEALVVPTVFDADSKALGEIARETRALAERVRTQAITPPELGGGTFTVSNLGMLGVREFTAIVNPPQAAILTVGALENRAVVAEDGTIVARRMLTLTLISDHRVLFGADAARFLARVRELLQSPAALTL